MSKYDDWDRIPHTVIGTREGATSKMTIRGDMGENKFTLYNPDINMDSQMGETRIEVRDEQYRDDEHDLCKLGFFTVIGFHLSYVRGPWLTFDGHMTSRGYYPEGTNPLSIARDPQECTECPYKIDGFHFVGAKYLPPVKEHAALRVSMTLRFGDFDNSEDD